MKGTCNPTRPSASSPRGRARLAYGFWPGVILLGLLGRPAHAVDINVLPFIIDQPGTYTMTTDLDQPVLGANAITIVASNVVLDLGGHALTGNQGGGVVVVGVSEVTVMNGVISGFGNGVTLDNASGNTVTGITASFNNYGIVMFNASQNLIQGNTCNNQLGLGIWILFANGNTLLENTCNDNFTAGIEIDGDGNTLDSNTTNNNSLQGGILLNGNGNILHKNNANNNAHGILFTGPGGANTLLKNTTNNNPGVGIFVGGSDGNTVRLNTANGNGAVGINCNGSGNFFHKNTALNTGIYDLQDATCTNTWKNNVFVTSCAGPSGCNLACIQ